MSRTEHLVIDAYNVMHCCDEYQAMMNQDIEAARNNFIKEIKIIHDQDDLYVSVVFDGKGNKIQIINPDKNESFTCIYTASDVSADAVIERLLMRAPDPAKMTVVSRDNMVAESIRASGGILMLPEELFDWVDRCRKNQTEKIKKITPKKWKLGDEWK